MSKGAMMIDEEKLKAHPLYERAIAQGLNPKNVVLRSLYLEYVDSIPRYLARQIALKTLVLPKGRIKVLGRIFKNSPLHAQDEDWVVSSKIKMSLLRRKRQLEAKHNRSRPRKRRRRR